MEKQSIPAKINIKKKVGIRNVRKDNNPALPKVIFSFKNVFELLGILFFVIFIGWVIWFTLTHERIKTFVFENTRTVVASNVVAGVPVKVVTLVNANEMENGKKFVSIPSSAKILSIKKINAQGIKNIKPEKLNFTDEQRKNFIEKISSKKSSVSFFNFNSMLADVSEAVEQAFSDLLTDPTQLVDVSDVSEEILEPEIQEEPVEPVEEPQPVAEEILEPEIQEEPVGGSNDMVQLGEPCTGEQTDNCVAVEYEMPAPTIEKTDTSAGQLVTVSSLEESVQMVDVLAFSTIPEIYKAGEERKIKIKWKSPDCGAIEDLLQASTCRDNGEVSFVAKDLDADGYLDYVEWTVPHLSEQIFEIIFISKAFLLDQNQNIIADIYDQVALQDDVFADVTGGEYVRYTFEEILDSTKDNTIYAKPFFEGQPARAEIYPVYSNVDGSVYEGPMVGVLENIDHEGFYKILLTNLQEPTSVFDLRVVGNLRIDLIVDPPTACVWTGTTNSTWTTTTNWSDCGGSYPQNATYSVTINAGMTNWPTTGAARTIGDLTVDASAQLTLGGILSIQDDAGTGTTGSATINGAVTLAAFAIRTDGDMTFGATGSVTSSGAVTLYADYDNSGAGTLTMVDGATVSGTSVAIDSVGAQTLEDITSSGANNITINANRKPASVAINGAIVNSNTTGRTLTIYSNGDIDQNAAIGSGSDLATVNLYFDQDNSGDSINFSSTNLMTATTNLYFYGKANASFTLTSLDSDNSIGGSLNIGSTTAGAKFGTVVLAVDFISLGNILIYSDGNITQNTNVNIGTSGTLTIYADHDGDSSGAFVMNSGSSAYAGDAKAIAIDSSGDMVLYTLDNEGAANISIGANRKPSSVTVNGKISNRVTAGRTLTIYSNGDITQNVDVGDGGGGIFATVTLYVDNDNSGSATYTCASGTIFASSAINILGQSTTALSVGGLVATGNATITIGSATTLASVSIDGVIYNSTVGKILTIYSLGDVDQNADIGTSSYAFATVNLYFDQDNTGDSCVFNSASTIYASTNVYLRSKANAGLTLTALTISGAAPLNIGSTTAATKFGTVTINGDPNTTGNILIYADGDIVFNTSKTLTSAGTLTIYADHDNNGTGTVTMNSGSAMTAGSAKAIAIDGVGAMVLNTITNSGAADITINANRKPASVTLNGVISNSNTSRAITIYSNGDITQNADIGTTGIRCTTVSLYYDQDNSGDAIIINNTTNTIFVNTNLYFYGKGLSSITYAAALKTGTAPFNIGSTTAGRKFGTVTINGDPNNTGNILIYSDGDIIINSSTTITSTGAITIYADHDADGANVFTMNSGSALVSAGITINGPGAMTLNTITGSGTTNVTIGATIQPASVTINGVISNSTNAARTLAIYSDGDITQNANLGSASYSFGTVTLYYDYDNTGDAIALNTASTIYVGTTLNIYGRTNASFTYTAVTISGNAALNIGAVADSTLDFGTVTINSNISFTGAIAIYANAGFTQNTDKTITSGVTVTISSDFDGGTAGDFTMNSGTSITAGPGDAITLDGSGAMTLGTLTNSGAADITIGNTRKPTSVTINGVISNSNTAGRILTIYSNGDIDQNANIGSSSYNFSYISFYFDQDNTGDEIVFDSASTIYASSQMFFYAKPNTTTTITSINAANAHIYFGNSNATDCFGSITINGNLSLSNSASFMACNGITQNSDKSITTSSGAVALYADTDNNSIGALTMNSGTSITAPIIQVMAGGTMTLNTLTNSGASDILIGNYEKPSSVIINGVISNSNTTGRDLIIYSNGDITQNADIGSSDHPYATVTLYVDNDNSGTGSYTYTSGTTYASTNIYIEPGTSTALAVTGFTSSGAAPFYIGNTTDPASVTTSGTISTGGAVTIDADNNINQGGSITANSGSSAITLNPNTSVGAYKAYISDNSTITGTTYTVNGDLTINSAKALTANSTDIAVTGTFANIGTLKLKGDESLSSLTKDTAQGTVEYVGTTDALNYGNTYYNVNFNNASATWTLGATLTVGNNMTVTLGKVDYNGQAVNITNDLTYYAGGLAPTDADAMDGAVITVGGNASFAGTAPAPINFKWTGSGAGAWSLIITGNLGMDYVTFTPATTNTMLLQVHGASAVVTNTVAAYSDASGAGHTQIDATSASNTNNDNNTNWNFEGGNTLPVASSVAIVYGAGDSAPPINLTSATTTQVKATFTVTDDNGCSDLDSGALDTDAIFYRTGVGSSCTPDAENCYNMSCTQDVGSCTGGADTTATYTCTSAVQFYADPTDAGSTYSASEWTVTATPQDNADGGGTNASNTAEMNSLTSLSVTSTISYSALSLGGNTGTSDQTTTVTNAGNRAIDTQVGGYGNASGDGYSAKCTVGNVAVAYEKFATSASTAYASKTALQSDQSPNTISNNIAKGASSTANVYWGMGLPASGIGSSCSGYIVFTAVNH